MDRVSLCLLSNLTPTPHYILIPVKECLFWAAGQTFVSRVHRGKLSGGALVCRFPVIRIPLFSNQSTSQEPRKGHGREFKGYNLAR